MAGDEAGPTLSKDDRYRLLIEAVNDYAIYMLDPKGVVASWNPGAERFKGYVESEIIGEHFSRFYTDEDRDAGLPALALRTAEIEGRFEREGWRVRKDGTRMWAHVIIDPIRDAASGGLIGFAKITRDITAQREARRALKASEERFRLLVQGVKDYAIYMLDPEGHVANWNTGAQRFKGYAENEIVGKHFSRFYTEEDRQTDLPKRALKIAADEGQFEAEGWRVRKDGSQFWANVVIDAIRSDDGELIGFAKVTRDVTEKRLAQEALEAARENLVQSQKMEAIGQLTGGIAHDFNNLLAVVLGNLDMLRKRLPPDPKARQLLENSMQAAERGATLTARMLAFARRQPLHAKPLDVLEVVRNMSDLLARSIGPDVQITTQFPLRLLPAMADANQLELAVLNLVLNARDAMPDGGEITIRARSETVKVNDVSLSAGDYVCVSVADTGTGMEPKTLERAVEPFFTTKGVGKGTGLGLSMIHGFATQSGGRLLLKSNPGQGTTAEVWLPIAHQVEVEPEKPEDEGAVAQQTPICVLVVDDDPLVMMNTTAMLEELGHSVLEATSGDQALRVLRRTPNVQLVITDHVMPGMTGAALIAELSKINPALPVILATGYTELREDQSPVGALRLSKPYRQKELVRAILEAMGSRAGLVLPFRPKHC
jgi:PAS domain S-box-containing protein